MGKRSRASKESEGGLTYGQYLQLQRMTEEFDRESEYPVAMRRQPLVLQSDQYQWMKETDTQRPVTRSVTSIGRGRARRRAATVKPGANQQQNTAEIGYRSEGGTEKSAAEKDTKGKDTMKTLTGTIRPCGRGRARWVASSPALPAGHGQARTQDQARNDNRPGPAQAQRDSRVKIGRAHV